VGDPTSVASKGGDAYKTTYTFSQPSIDYLLQLKIPVLVSYGTKDHGVPFNNYLRLETIRQGKRNFTFHPYIGVEHNYFGFDKEGRVDHGKFSWDQVVEDWHAWLDEKHVLNAPKANM
jgi:dienelactone hydrolase